MRIYLGMNSEIWDYVFTHEYIYTYTYTFVYLYVYACMCVYMSIYARMNICRHIYSYKCSYTHVHVHTHPSSGNKGFRMDSGTSPPFLDIGREEDGLDVRSTCPKFNQSRTKRE